MTSAFVPFSNGGYPVVPYAVKRILTRDGKVVYERNGSGFPQAITEVDLGSMNRMMRAVVTNGTGNARSFPGRRDWRQDRHQSGLPRCLVRWLHQ